MSKLYAPMKIGKVEMRNRLVVAAMTLVYADKGKMTNQMIEFYRQRAEGGAGLIIFGGLQVDPIRQTDADFVKINGDGYISGLLQLTEAVHKEDSKIFAQLWHAGRYARSKVYSGMEAVAPSAVPSRYTGETPRELTITEIEDIVQYFAEGAWRSVEAGFDGIEICTNSGYLPGQFLSAYTNKRTDKYGGDLNGRMTFLLELVKAARNVVGPDYPIIVRLGGNDFMEGGNTNTEAKHIAAALESAGVDAISVTGGWHEALVPQLTMDVPHGAFRYLGQGIKSAVNIPVIISNRMNIAMAERMVDEGNADFIAMARPFIADSELANKASLGNYREIRACVGCNQGCLDKAMAFEPVVCLCNAEAGREYELLQDGTPPTRVKSSNPESILVIGAGVAGLEFSRVAALRGHQVTIWEAGNKAGGQANIAAAPPGRQDFAYLVDYLVYACEQLGVQIVYNQKADKASILKPYQTGGFNRVVIATGASPITPKIPVEKGANVVQAWDLLKDLSQIDLGKNIVVVGGNAVGVETALLLAEIGTIDAMTLKHLMLNKAETPESLYRLMTCGTKHVTVVEMEKSLGKDIGFTSRWPITSKLKMYGVDSRTKAKVISVKKDGVVIAGEDGQETLISADTIVFAVGSRSENGLYEELSGSVNQLEIIGDACSPKKIMDAVKAGYDAAIAIM